MENSRVLRPVRVNARISVELNDWLDRRSQEVGISKSGLISLAIENYKKETEVVNRLPQIMARLDELGVDIKRL